MKDATQLTGLAGLAARDALQHPEDASKSQSRERRDDPQDAGHHHNTDRAQLAAFRRD